MQLTAEQQKAIDAQKEQCPFCKIVKGDIQSKKVYDDDKIIAILDINPAAKGHTLVMPKEHYPIMPLIPQDVFEHLFTKTKHLASAIKEGLLLFDNTIFIANGYAAGQQSSHFMLHIIPREATDELDFFTLKRGAVEIHKTEDIYKLLSNNLPLMLKQRYAKYPLPQETKRKPPETSSQRQASITPQVFTKESLIQLIESNEQLKQFIIEFPEQFKEQVNNNPRLQKAFENIDINDIIEYYAPKKQAPKYTMEELVKIINDNPKLKDMLLKETFQFAEKVQQIPELREIFEGVDVEQLERAVLEQEAKEEQDIKELLTSIAKIKKPEEDAEETTISEMPIEEEKIEEEKIEEEKIEEENAQVKKQGRVKKQKQEEGADIDLVSKLYREMLEGK